MEILVLWSHAAIFGDRNMEFLSSGEGVMKFNILVYFFVCKLYYNYYLVSDFLRSCLSSICLFSLYFFVRPAVTSCFTLLPSRLVSCNKTV